MWHAADAWSRRHEGNVLLFHYADLSADLEAEMRRLAGRLGIEVPEQTWPMLVAAASFENMRSHADDLAPAPPGILKDRVRSSGTVRREARPPSSARMRSPATKPKWRRWHLRPSSPGSTAVPEADRPRQVPHRRPRTTGHIADTPRPTTRKERAPSGARSVTFARSVDLGRDRRLRRAPHRHLRRLGLLPHRHGDREHTVVVGSADGTAVELPAESDLALVGPGGTLPTSQVTSSVSSNERSAVTMICPFSTVTSTCSGPTPGRSNRRTPGKTGRGAACSGDGTGPSASWRVRLLCRGGRVGPGSGSVDRNSGLVLAGTPASKPEASLISVGSLHARPMNEIPTGSPNGVPAGTVTMG